MSSFRLIGLVPATRPLIVLGLICVEFISVVAAEPLEREEQKIMLAVVQKTQYFEEHDRSNLPEIYQESRRRLAGLEVSDSNRVKLLQARTLLAVLAQDWDEFGSLAKEFGEKDFWLWHIKTWRLQMRVDREEWKPLVDDVTRLIDELLEQRLDLNAGNPTAEVGIKLLVLRQALIWPNDKEVPRELQIVAEQIDRLKVSYNKIPRSQVYPGYSEDFEWLSKVDFLPGSLTREQLRTMIASQASAVILANAEFKGAGKERGREQSENRTGRAEGRYWEAKRGRRFESGKLALLRNLERTADSQLSMAFRARLWVWQSSVNASTEYFKSNWVTGLVDSINQKP